MTKHKISVVIPYFNREAFIDESLQSVFKQTRPADEIIIVDDGSTPDSAQFLQQYADQVKIVRLAQNAGPAKARNVGVENAQGDLIAFLDSDDTWEPEKLALQSQYMRNHSICVATYTGTRVFNQDGIQHDRIYTKKPAVIKLRNALFANHVSPPSLMIRKDVYISLGGYDRYFRCTEDQEFVIRLVAAGYEIHFIPTCLLNVRRFCHQNLSANILSSLKGHLRVVWKHRILYSNEGGRGIVRKLIIKHICSRGQKNKSFKARIVLITGRLLALFFFVSKQDIDRNYENKLN